MLVQPPAAASPGLVDDTGASEPGDIASRLAAKQADRDARVEAMREARRDKETATLGRGPSISAVSRRLAERRQLSTGGGGKNIADRERDAIARREERRSKLRAQLKAKEEAAVTAKPVINKTSARIVRSKGHLAANPADRSAAWERQRQRKLEAKRREVRAKEDGAMTGRPRIDRRSARLASQARARQAESVARVARGRADTAEGGGPPRSGSRPRQPAGGASLGSRLHGMAAVYGSKRATATSREATKHSFQPTLVSSASTRAAAKRQPGGAPPPAAGARMLGPTTPGRAAAEARTLGPTTPGRAAAGAAMAAPPPPPPSPPPFRQEPTRRGTAPQSGPGTLREAMERAQAPSLRGATRRERAQLDASFGRLSRAGDDHDGMPVEVLPSSGRSGIPSLRPGGALPAPAPAAAPWGLRGDRSPEEPAPPPAALRYDPLSSPAGPPAQRQPPARRSVYALRSPPHRASAPYVGGVAGLSIAGPSAGSPASDDWMLLAGKSFMRELEERRLARG